MFTRLCWVFLLFFSANVGAQNTPAAPVPSSPDYSKEGSVINSSKTVVTFNADGTFTREQTSEVRITGDAGLQQWGVLSVDYTSAEQKASFVYIRVRKPDGTVIPTPAENIQDMPAEVTRVAPFYSDLHQLQGAVKGLGVGDSLEYQVRVEATKPVIADQFWFGYTFVKDVVSLDERLEISVPRDRYVNVKSPALKPQVEDAGQRRNYKWKVSHAQHEEAKKAVIGRAPQPDVLVTSFRGWDELGSWWRSISLPMAAPTAEITAKTAELTKNAQSDDEKMRAIFKFVSSRFRYIGISFGIGRLQPHPANEVLHNEYGDCKDKHTLLAALLQAAGIEAYPALIPSQHEIDPDSPSPLQFDHVITAVPRNGKYIWLDSTIEVAPFGYLIRTLRGKQALVVPKDKPPVLAKIPADLPFPSVQTYHIDAKIGEDGVLKGHVQRTARGDFEVLLRASFRSVPPNNWKEIVQAASRLNGFAGDVSEITVSTPDDTDNPLAWSYEYTRKDYPGWNRQFSAPIGFMGLAPLDDPSLTSFPVLLAGPGEIVFTASVTFPDGYSVSPCRAVKVERDFASYSSTCGWKDHVLTAEHKLILKVSELPPARNSDYTAFQKAVTDDETEQMTVVSPGAQQQAESEFDAQQLLEEGRQAIMRRDFQTAVDRLQSAAKESPDLPQVWGMLAFAHMNLNKFEDCESDLRKGLAANPRNIEYYKMLGGVLGEKLHRTDEAMQVLRDGLKIDPTQPDLHAEIAYLLMQMKRPSEAAVELQKAVASSHNQQYEFRLAQAYAADRQEQKAVETYAEIVKQDPSPEVLNAAAWNMVELNLALPTALKYSQDSIDIIEKQTTKVELAKLSQDDLLAPARLAAFWDTLGWIYYRQGKLPDAEKYLSAAWALSQDTSIGDHLGQLYEELGRNADAAHLYALAVAADTRYSEARSHLDHAYHSRAAAEAAVEKARSELSEMRLVKLPIVAHKGSAEFFLLLSAGGKVEDVKFVSGSEELRSASKAVGAAHYELPLPDAGGERIVRRGVLTCSQAIHRCDFVLYTPDMVRSVN